MMILRLPSSRSLRSAYRNGWCLVNSPSRRASEAARSNRKPSMPIRLAQYRSESMANATTGVFVKSSVLPQPVVSSSRPGLPLLLAVVGECVQSAPADGRSFHTALAGVVVHHVHDDLEARLVQGAHHVDDLLAHGRRTLALRVAGGVGGFRREIAQRGVTPVVGAAALLQEQLVLLGLDRQQLDGGHAQPFGDRRAWWGAPDRRRCRAAPPAATGRRR